MREAGCPCARPPGCECGNVLVHSGQDGLAQLHEGDADLRWAGKI